MAIKPAALIDQLYAGHPLAHRILLEHSRKVTCRALSIARLINKKGLSVDLQFIAEAAMLHDIGMIQTFAPDIGCTGNAPYLQHGIIGAQILSELGLERHARVCERHTGVGLTAEEIVREQLPLPARNLLPETLEEKIICYADLFYSKKPSKAGKEKSVAAVRRQLQSFGAEKLIIFDQWQQDFESGTI